MEHERVVRGLEQRISELNKELNLQLSASHKQQAEHAGLQERFRHTESQLQLRLHELEDRLQQTGGLQSTLESRLRSKSWRRGATGVFFSTPEGTVPPASPGCSVSGGFAEGGGGVTGSAEIKFGPAWLGLDQQYCWREAPKIFGKGSAKMAFLKAHQIFGGKIPTQLGLAGGGFVVFAELSDVNVFP